MSRQGTNWGLGCLYRKTPGGPWWVQRWQGGRHRQFSTGTHDRARAEEIRREMLAATTWVPEWLRARDDLRVRDLLEAEVERAMREGHVTVDNLRQKLRPVERFFGAVRPGEVTPELVERFREERLAEGRSLGTVASGLGLLKRGLRLAYRAGLLESRAALDAVSVDWKAHGGKRPRPQPEPAALPDFFRPPGEPPPFDRPPAPDLEALDQVLVRHVTQYYLHHLRCKRPDAVAHHLKPVERHLGHIPIEELRPFRLRQFRSAYQRERGVCDATVDRSIEFLRAAMHQAREDELVERLPRSWAHAGADNVREGFASPPLLARLIEELPPDVADVVELTLHTGWRKAAVLALEWGSVDWESRTLSLPGGLSKNGRPVYYPIREGPVPEVLRRRERKAVERGHDAPWIFLRANGRPIRCYRTAWRRACVRAGCPGLLVHDLRRSLALMHLEAGTPRAWTMQLAGWRSTSIYDRYVPPDRSMLEGVVDKAAAHYGRAAKGAHENDAGDEQGKGD